MTVDTMALTAAVSAKPATKAGARVETAPPPAGLAPAGLAPAVPAAHAFAARMQAMAERQEDAATGARRGAPSAPAAPGAQPAPVTAAIGTPRGDADARQAAMKGDADAADHKRAAGIDPEETASSRTAAAAEPPPPAAPPAPTPFLVDTMVAPSPVAPPAPPTTQQLADRLLAALDANHCPVDRAVMVEMPGAPLAEAAMVTRNAAGDLAIALLAGRGTAAMLAPMIADLRDRLVQRLHLRRGRAMRIRLVDASDPAPDAGASAPHRA